MAARPSIALLLLAALGSMGATYRTQNFVVEAPTQALAEEVGKYAEAYRKEKAIQWLGQEMPPWGTPCPLNVTVTPNDGGGGATSFRFEGGAILSQNMHIEGSPNRLVASVLPHEVTHTVFAYYFRQPVPRWADEGGSVLSEDDYERQKHDSMVRSILNTPGRPIPLRRLFSLREYPRDVMVLYAEGYSVTDFLVAQSGRQNFLAFVNQGMRSGWDDAGKRYYGYKNVEEMEQAWLQHLRDTKRQPQGTMLASGRDETRAEPVSRMVVRQTAPASAQLQEPQELACGHAMKDLDDRYDARVYPTSRPTYLPDFRSPSTSSSSPPSPSASWPPPSQVRLSPPQIDGPPPRVQLGEPVLLTPSR
jgi:hypothetical protein